MISFLSLVCALPLAAMTPVDLSAEKPETRLEWHRDLAEPEAERVKVEIELGGDDVDSVTTIKGETRRLYALNIAVPKGGSRRLTFYVECRTPVIFDAQHQPVSKVSLKSREVGSKSWDRALSFEFLGEHPRVRKIATEVLTNCPVPVIYLAGDSTVTDQSTEPYMGWGQALPLFFGDHACVANHAESGLTLKSFKGSHRLEKIVSVLRPGDFVLVQFGHNDQKEKGEGVGAFTSYAQSLRDYVAAIKSKGGKAILVTSVARRRFDDQGKVVESLGDFPAAVRQVAQELKVPLLDLNAISKQLYQSLGSEGSVPVFLHFPAHTFPGQDAPLRDDTHFSSWGAYAIARCAVQGMQQTVPELASLLNVPADGFTAEKPEVLTKIKIPASLLVKSEKPDGK
jgi:lysophospholipase L1-like esterase